VLGGVHIANGALDAVQFLIGCSDAFSAEPTISRGSLAVLSRRPTDRAGLDNLHHAKTIIAKAKKISQQRILV
jgi:hypothetical protein